MQKAYETPRAEKFEFNYLENVVASNTVNGPNANPHANYHAQNSCYTHNGSDVADHNCNTDNPKNGNGNGNGNGHGHGHH